MAGGGGLDRVGRGGDLIVVEELLQDVLDHRRRRLGAPLEVGPVYFDQDRELRILVWGIGGGAGNGLVWAIGTELWNGSGASLGRHVVPWHQGQACLTADRLV